MEIQIKYTKIRTLVWLFNPVSFKWKYSWMIQKSKALRLWKNIPLVDIDSYVWRNFSKVFLRKLKMILNLGIALWADSTSRRHVHIKVLTHCVYHLISSVWYKQYRYIVSDSDNVLLISNILLVYLFVAFVIKFVKSRIMFLEDGLPLNVFLVSNSNWKCFKMDN